MITRKQLRSKINTWSGEWEDFVFDTEWIPSKVGDALSFPTDNGFRFWVCQLLNSHEGTMDHCGMPEHDFCIYCQTSMPFQGENLELRLRRKYVHKYCPDCSQLKGYEYCEAHETEAKKL